MVIYLGSDKIGDITKVIGSDSLNVKNYMNDEILTGGYLEEIKSLRPFAYYNQKKLETITLPKTLETMGSRAFSYCDSLKQVTCKAIVPPVINFSYDDYYFGTNVEIIYIPVGTLDSYSSAAYWSKYAGKFVEKEDL